MSTPYLYDKVYDRGASTLQQEPSRDRIIQSGGSHASGSTIQPLGIATYSINKTTGSLYVKLRPERTQSKVMKSIQTDISVIADIDDEGYVGGIELLLTDKEIIDKIRINSLDR